jgi:hypothetical protein
MLPNRPLSESCEKDGENTLSAHDPHPQRKEVHMTTRAFVAVLAVSVATVSGCAGAGAGSGFGLFDRVQAALAPASGLSGTWHGSFSWVSAFFYTDEADCVLRIGDDGTFTETITPGKSANNLAKTEKWSGTIVVRGNQITLRTSQGPSLTLIRTGDTLYGVAEDPVTEAPIMMRFERYGGSTESARNVPSGVRDATD